MASPSLESRPAFQDLSTIPNTSPYWFEIGKQLGVGVSTLQTIKRTQNNDLKRKREMFRKLLDMRPSLTWRDVLHALVDSGCSDSAKQTCVSFDWPVSVLEGNRSIQGSMSTTGYASDDTSGSNLMLELLKPPESEETTTASVRSASESVPMDTDSEEFHSLPSAGDDFGSGPTPWKPSTTSFGTTSFDSKGSVSTPRARTEFKTGLTPAYKSFQSTRHDVEPHPIHTQSSIVSPEYRTLVECTSKLTALLKHDLLEISDHLFAQGLISEDIREQLTLQTVEEQRRASRLVSHLTDRVKTNPSIFKEFVSVLKVLGPWTQDIVKYLEEVYAKNREGFGSSDDSHLLTFDLREKLRVAVIKGDIDTVMRVFGSNPEAVDAILNEKKQTALIIAAIEGHKELVSYLLDKKASVSHRDIEGATVVFITASVGNYEVLKMLLANPRAIAEINTKNRFGNPILLDPASKGFSMVSEYLLENRANPNDTTKDGVTPLYKACEKGQREVAKVLLEHGADVVRPCRKTSRTPLEEAVEREHNELIPVLVKALKKVNEKNKKLFTTTTVEALRALVNKGADVDTREKNGVTPLMVHTEKREKDLVQELIKLRANVDLQNNDGYSALMIAARLGDSVIVQIFIGASAILDFKEKERGHTALMLATIGLHTRVVKELVLAKADINIKSRDGRTALDMAKELNYKEIVDLLTPTQSQSSNGDPFIDLLSTYLSDKDKGQRTQKTAPQPARPTHRPMVPKPVSQDRDETSELRDELKKSYRRIADLETRVHDLTLQTSLEFPMDTDLSYMDRSRLESEFRKTKELKKKAEHYAVEAKQTAQRLSAENFKLKEDLSKERHHNELTRKNLLREMEQKVDRQAASADLLNAKKEVFEREISIRAHQLLRSMPRDQMQPSESVFELSPEEVVKVIKNGRVRVSTVLVAVTGLPYSGRTTLLRNILGGKERSTITSERVYQIPGFRMYEAIVRRDLTDNTMDIFPSVKQQAETHAIATVLVRRLTSQRQGIKVPDNLVSLPHLFGEDTDMHEYCLTTCQYLSELILELETTDRLKTLVQSAVTFINFYDVGMNKAVFEILPPLVGGRLKRIVQINALNLAVYGTVEALCKPPPLKNLPALAEKYSPRGDDDLMVLSSTRDFFLQPVFAAHGYGKQIPSTLMVATNTDKIHNDKDVKKRKKFVNRSIRRRAEEIGLSGVLCENFIDVNATDEEDCNKVKSALLELINSQRQHLEVDMPLSALFLRCFLNNKKWMFISRDRLLQYAKKVGIEDLDEFLSIFLHCGSLFCSLDQEIPFFYDYIILDPPAFVQEMDILYYLEFHAKSLPADLDAEVRNTKLGIVTDRLAKKIWSGTSEDQLTSYDFCLGALLALEFIVPIKRSILPPEYFPELPEYGDCYFMPNVRPAFCNRPRINHDSLYITYDIAIVPFRKLGQFVEYLQTWHEETIRFKPCSSYNKVEFEWVREPESDNTEKVATVSVIFQSGGEACSQGAAVEVKVDMEPEYKESDEKPYIYSVVKTACVNVFNQTEEEIPALKYKLAIACPLQSVNPLKKQKSHFLPFQISDEDGIGIFCRECGQCTSEQERNRLLWVRAQYHGPKCYDIYPEDLLTDEELGEIATRLIIQTTSKLVLLAAELGQTKEEFYGESAIISMQERLLSLLRNWRKPRKGRSKKDLGVILNKCGLHLEACRMDVKYMDYKGKLENKHTVWLDDTPSTVIKKTTGTKSLTIEELKKKTGVADIQLDSQIVETDLPDLAGCFDNVDTYLQKFQLTPAQQTDVKNIAHQHNTTVAATQVLRLWRQSNPFAATFRALLEILLDLRKGDVADRVCHYIINKVPNC